MAPIQTALKKIITTKPALALFPFFLVFLAILLPLAQNYIGFRDDLISFEHSEKTSGHLSAIWETNTNHRRHPVFFLFLFLESRLFGVAPIGYFIVIFFIHFANAVLVIRLAKRFGIPPLGAFFGGLLFLCSSAFYQALIFIPSTLIVLSLLFFLFGLDAYLDHLEKTRFAFARVLVFQTLALLSYEVSIVFPLMAGLSLCLYPPPQKKTLSVFIRTLLPLFLVATAVLLFIAKDFIITPAAHNKISIEGLTLFFPRLVSLVRVFIGTLFIPDKHFLFLYVFDNPILRIAPLALFVTVFCALALTRMDALKNLLIPKKIVIISLGWIGIAILPHMANQLTFEHTTRHLYFAAVGFSFLFGSLALHCLRTLRSLCPQKAVLIFGALLTYILTLNLFSTAYHYQEYQKIAQNNPQYNQQIRELLLKHSAWI